MPIKRWSLWGAYFSPSWMAFERERGRSRSTRVILTVEHAGRFFRRLEAGESHHCAAGTLLLIQVLALSRLRLN